ncbi:MAG TPA: phosphotransferase [Acidimicrobiia bacterium]
MAVMTCVDDLLDVASDVLSARVGRTVDLLDAMQLESKSTVIRARVSSTGEDLPSTVIIKHVTDEEFDQPGHTGPPSRFLNEWSALEFLTDLDGEVAPRLIAADEGKGLTIVEDLGDLPTLENLLSAGLESSAMDGLEVAGELLGRLHAMSRDLEDEFAFIQSRLGTRSPLSDSTVDQRGREDVFLAILHSLGIEPGKQFWDDLHGLESLIHDGSPFRSLIHADAGPHNVLVNAADSRLIDFEFAVYGDVFSDAVGARLGFPQTMSVGQVPMRAVETLEASYREAIAAGIPQAEDDALFGRHLTAACGHWALNRWRAAWRDHPSAAPSREPPAEAVVRGSRSLWLVIDGFVAAVDEFGEFEALADALCRFRARATARWPELEPAPVYPAFRNL